VYLCVTCVNAHASMHTVTCVNATVSIHTHTHTHTHTTHAPERRARGRCRQVPCISWSLVSLWLDLIPCISWSLVSRKFSQSLVAGPNESPHSLKKKAAVKWQLCTLLTVTDCVTYCVTDCVTDYVTYCVTYYVTYCVTYYLTHAVVKWQSCIQRTLMSTAYSHVYSVLSCLQRTLMSTAYSHVYSVLSCLQRIHAVYTSFSSTNYYTESVYMLYTHRLVQLTTTQRAYTCCIHIV
jgi:hypothetical protein